MGTHPEQPRLDLVFVHGLDGHWLETWSHNGEKTGFWPLWVAEEHPDLAVWSLEYPAVRTAWRGPSMSILEHADDVLDCLRVARIGQRPLVFVCHSLGGLLVKQMLRTTAERKDVRHIGEATMGVAFFATPNTGSRIASLAGSALALLGPLGVLYRSSDILRELQANAPQIRNLNDWFRNHVAARQATAPLRVKVWYEKRGPLGILVVDETSANPGLVDVTPLGVAADHFTICKPFDAQDRRILNIIELCQTPTGARETTSKTARASHSQAGTEGTAPPKAFISYAHEDRAWCERLLQHLGALRHQGRLALWADDEIMAGEEWDRAIRRELDEAAIIVLIVTPAFLNSAFCQTVELKRAMERHGEGSARVIPIIADHCHWTSLPIKSLQARPQDENRNLKPLVDWPNANIPLADIAREIDRLTQPRSSAQTVPPHVLSPRRTGPHHHGVALANLGEPRKAIELHEQQLVIAQEIGDLRGTSNALDRLGSAWAELGEWRKAIECYERQLAIAREIGDRRSEGNVLDKLGVAWMNLGEPRKAIGHDE